MSKYMLCSVDLMFSHIKKTPKYVPACPFLDLQTKFLSKTKYHSFNILKVLMRDYTHIRYTFYIVYK